MNQNDKRRISLSSLVVVIIIIVVVISVKLFMVLPQKQFT